MELDLDLIIPVYLNQRTVFDLIAMLQGGISTITRVTSTESSGGFDQQNYGVAFGLNKAFSSLMKVDLKGDRSKKQEENSITQLNEERIHTPASLFQILRHTVSKNKKLKIIRNDYSPTTGDFVEFVSPLRKNPVIESMETYFQIMETFTMLFKDSKQLKKGDKNKDVDSTTRVKKQIQTFLENLKSGETVDIVTDALEGGFRAVITLEKSFLNDKTMSDLVDGEFNVVGKIIRVIRDKSDSINLIRKTPISVMPEQQLKKLFGSMSSAAEKQGIAVPDFELKIHGPVIHILPIAIFT